MSFKCKTISQTLSAFALLSTLSLQASAAPSDETYLKASQVACSAHLDSRSEACYEEVLMKLVNWTQD